MTMTRERVLAYVKQQYGVEPDFPWGKLADYAVLRHGDNQKWFGLLSKVACSKLGLAGEGDVALLNVKCEPELIDILRTKPGILPAYHMNKTHWLSIVLDGTVADRDVLDLVDVSFELTL